MMTSASRPLLRWGIILMFAGAVPSIKAQNGIFADFVTSKGNFTCQLDYTNAPRTVANFIGLATGQRPWMDWNTGRVRTNAFYNGLIFHRVIANFMIQSGSPNGLGTDGPGYVLVDEISPKLKHDKLGVLAMAKSSTYDPWGNPILLTNTASSQFYITVTNNASWLDGDYSIFGLVVSNFSVVSNISRVATDGNAKPLTDVAIQSVTIRRVGPEAENFNVMTQALPLVQPVHLEITNSNHQVSLQFTNSYYAHNRLFESTNLLQWAAGELGVDVSPPLANSVPLSATNSASFFRVPRIQYPSSTFAPRSLDNRTLRMVYQYDPDPNSDTNLMITVTNVIAFDAAGGGTYTNSDESAGSGDVTSYSWYQDIYRGYIWPIYYSAAFPMAMRLEFTSDTGGTLFGAAYWYYFPDVPWYSISGTFTLSSP